MQATDNPLYMAIREPLVEFFRESLENQQAINRVVEANKALAEEQIKYLRARIDRMQQYNDLVESRLDDLTQVVMNLMNTGHSITRDEVQHQMRQTAQDSEDADFLWQLLLEVDTENEEEEVPILEEEWGRRM